METRPFLQGENISQITTYFCDRCKKEHKEWPNGWLWLREFFGEFQATLCEDCKKAFQSFMENKT